MKKQILSIVLLLGVLAPAATLLGSAVAKANTKISGANLKRMLARLKGLPDAEAMYEQAQKMKLEEINESINFFKGVIEKYQKIRSLGPLDSEILGFLIEFAKTYVAILEERKTSLEVQKGQKALAR